MPPPHNGNELTPFAALMRLQSDSNDDNTFHSIALAYTPGGLLERARGATYGGHVFAQAAWAACQTVAPDLLLYNITGSFILPGRPTTFTYRVERVRDGRSSATRIVHVTQSAEEGIFFTCTCAFRRDQTSALEIQPERQGLFERYGDALVVRTGNDAKTGHRPSDFPLVVGMDVPWYLDYLAEGGRDDDFPGLEMRQPDMDGFNARRHPLERRQLIFYRPIGHIPLDQPNLHLCAHLYASDRNGLYIIANLYDVGDLYTQIGSLTHTVVFHSPIEELLFRPSPSGCREGMDDDNGAGRWFGVEDWTDRAGGGRLLMHTRMWAADGTHIATALQDGMTRLSKKPTATADEIEAVRGRMEGWKARGKL